MTKGKLTNVIGDVTNPQFTGENEVAIIPHCCNDLGMMGAGVALALRKKWPSIFDSYHAMVMGHRNRQLQCLGKITYINVEENITVFNMIGQHGIVDEDNPKPVKYTALVDAMREVSAYISIMRMQNPEKKYVVHTPQFGSALAGGKRELIIELIQEIWIENGIDVVVYEFGK